MRIGDHGMGVRAAAGLHVGHVLRVGDVRDVEDPDPAQAILAHRFGNSLDAAIDAAGLPFARHEQQVPVDRHVALRRRAHIGQHRGRLRRIRDVVDLEAVVVALDGVLAGKGQIGVGDAEEFLRRRRGGHQLQIPRGLARVPLAGRQAHPRIRARRRRRHDRRDRRGHHRRRRLRRRRGIAASTSTRAASSRRIGRRGRSGRLSGGCRGRRRGRRDGRRGGGRGRRRRRCGGRGRGGGGRRHRRRGLRRTRDGKGAGGDRRKDERPHH